jgi:nicotinic acid mononucleotide adenylyltransferase
MKKAIVYTFGRFSPPHKGHEILVNAVVALAKKVSGDHVVYVSKSQDSKRNPLSVDQKVAYMRHAIRGANIVGASEQVPTFLEVAKQLDSKYENLYMVAGSDRVVDFKQKLDQYNGKLFNFKSIVVVSSGERDPDAEGASGLSATKMRQAAVSGNFNLFKSGVPSGMSVSMAKKMFDDVRAGLKITEQTDDLREKYIAEQIFNVGDIVIHAGQEMTIKFRGSNHVVLESQGITKRAWLTAIEPTDKVNESMKFKQEDKIKVARIIGMALGYMEAEEKTNPTNIINTALRMAKSKPLNPEAKKILTRMLQSARDAEIPFDEKLVPVLKEAVDSPKTLKTYIAKNNINADDDHIDHIEQDPEDEGPAVDKTDAKSSNLMLHPRMQPDFVRRMKIMYKRADESEEGETELNDDELDKIEQEIDDDHFIEHAYDDEEFEVVDEEDDNEPVEESFDYTGLVEVLSRAERMRARVRFAHTKAKRERGLKIALKKRSSAETIAKRARKAAVKAIELRLAKKPLNQLSIGEKERIEARVARMKNTVTKLATRLIPRIRKIEKDRLSSKQTQGAK